MSAATTPLETHPQRFISEKACFEVAVLTGCQDRQYAFGLTTALIEKEMCVDLIGSDEIDSPELHGNPNLRFLNFRGAQIHSAGLGTKLRDLVAYYGRLISYAARSKPNIFHILWNNKFEYFDRTLLILYYKACGKRIAFTAHNVNQGRRDGKDSVFNRFTLKAQYRLVDHIFVHTQKMKDELRNDFGVRESAVTVIRYPVNNALPDTAITSAEARNRLGLKDSDKALLFFGRIKPYKGLEYLLTAFRELTEKHPDYRLIIAGEPKKGSEAYEAQIRARITSEFAPARVISRMQFIPDEETELYLKAADVLILPYKDIFQSGVLFLAYSFGLPVIATDVGSFREDIQEGRTGFLSKSNDPADLSQAIETYFDSELYRNLNHRRADIRKHVKAHHSWEAAADLTCTAYAQILGRRA